MVTTVTTIAKMTFVRVKGTAGDVLRRRDRALVANLTFMSGVCPTVRERSSFSVTGSFLLSSIRDLARKSMRASRCPAIGPACTIYGVESLSDIRHCGNTTPPSPAKAASIVPKSPRGR
jgi:hypothetical protein